MPHFALFPLSLPLLLLLLIVLVVVNKLAKRDRHTPAIHSADQLRRAWGQLDAIERRIATLEGVVIEQARSSETRQATSLHDERR